MAEKNFSNLRIGKFVVPVALIITSLLCLIISTRSLDEVPQSVGLMFFGFFQKTFSGISNSALKNIQNFVEQKNLRKENEKYKIIVSEYQKTEQEIIELLKENQTLRSILNLGARVEYEKIVARIIAKSSSNIYNLLIIDKGTEIGIQKDMVVIAYQDGKKVLIGKILRSSHGVSRILPIYDSSAFVAARINNEQRYEGMITGQGSVEQNLVMNFVSKNAKRELKIGDSIITSGFESIYPPDIEIGKVTKIDSIDFRASLELEVQSTVDFGKLEYVFVLKYKPVNIEITE